MMNTGQLPPHIFRLNDKSIDPGPVVYWMSRDQRVRDNAALLFAQQQAIELKQPLIVAFNLFPSYLGAPLRHYHFMIQGLKKLEPELGKLNIPMVLLQGDAVINIPSLLEKTNAGLLITDFNPLRINRTWNAAVARLIPVAFFEADAHNIVPCRHASGKQEYGAYTLRPRLNRLLPEFLHEIPRLQSHPFPSNLTCQKPEWDNALQNLKCDTSAGPLLKLKSGTDGGFEVLDRFITEKLAHYDQRKNDPNEDAVSGLSPWLHFGQISALRVALSVKKAAMPDEQKAAFLEELIVRRELSDNFCLYNENYDSIAGLPRWANETLDAHRNDERDHLYGRELFEQAATHDELWNAAQRQMERTGCMHGYMRMYWAKKILEWSASPEEAIATAIYLNDKYSLDGRDPNGYAGILWSIGGLHDRPWFNRPVYGKIRYMSDNGCRSKFNTKTYISKFS